MKHTTHALTFFNIPCPQIYGFQEKGSDCSRYWLNSWMSENLNAWNWNFKLKKNEHNRKNHLSSKWYRYVANQSSFIGNYVIAFRVIAIKVETKRRRMKKKKKKRPTNPKTTYSLVNFNWVGSVFLLFFCSILKIDFVFFCCCHSLCARCCARQKYPTYFNVLAWHGQNRFLSI